MQTPATISTPATTGISRLLANLRRIFLRKLWLPRAVYELIPYAYAGLGLVALGSALYVPTWAWILPYLLLIGLTCLHAGAAILALRLRFRRRERRGP